jgi:hypothetical protein
VTTAVADFLRLHLTALGGVADDEPGGIRVLLPPDAAAALEVDEESILAIDEPPPEGAVDARLGSAFLERCVRARRTRPPLAGVALPGTLPRPLPDDRPVLLNAVRGGPARPRPRTPARYLAAHLRLTLQGDEVRHATLPVAVRLDDGAEVAPLDLAAAYPVAVAPLGEDERATATRTLQAVFRRAGPELLGRALEAIARRARRDLLRMTDYYASLDAEMARAVDRARSPEERSRRDSKRRLLPEELEARRAQLCGRLAAQLGAELVAATVVETEVDTCEVLVRRRARATMLILRRRAGDGVLEGPACASCARSALHLHVCDDRLHTLCERCGRSGRLDAARCPACRPRGASAFLALPVEDPTAALQLGR